MAVHVIEGQLESARTGDACTERISILAQRGEFPIGGPSLLCPYASIEHMNTVVFMCSICVVKFGWVHFFIQIMQLMNKLFAVLLIILCFLN